MVDSAPQQSGSAAAPDIGVAILGAGFAGICMAIKLRAAGREDFTVFEKARGLGGTWRDNTYPGCACDVPSHLYSYSFAQNPHWSRTHAQQPEILAYWQRVAAEHDVVRHIAFATPIDEITWDDSARRWRLRCGDGRTFTARVVVSAVGALHLPKAVRLPGLETFEGPAFHSAHWRHDVDLNGRAVAVIGTGASAIQFIPEIASRVGLLTVYQRSPPWVLPRNDRPVSRLMRTLFAIVPGLLRAWRAVQYWRAEAVALGLAHKPKLMGRGQKRSARFKDREIADEELRLKLNPFYTMGCKRVLLSDDFYATMTRPNVELVTDPIREIRGRSIVTADGRERPCDVIIQATGFEPFNPTKGMVIRGRDGRSLADDWEDLPQAFRGVAVAGYPNYFMLMGPNSGLGHNSIVFMIEAQVRYVMQCLGWLTQGLLDTVEVRPEVQHAENQHLQARFSRTVWQATRGSDWQLPCTSWYVDSQGRNATLWPGLSATYWLLMRRADIAHYLANTEKPGSAAATQVPAAAAPLAGRPRSLDTENGSRSQKTGPA
jgi:cation diffusion facilitator CzcD-associated flavoprotein CzcO